MEDVSHNAIIIKILEDLFGSEIAGIGPVPLPDNVDLTSTVYITVLEVVGLDIEGLDGDEGLASGLMQVNCFCKTQETAAVIRARVKRGLSGYTGTVLGIVVEGSNHVNNAELYDGRRELHQMVTRLKFWFEEE